MNNLVLMKILCVGFWAIILGIIVVSYSLWGNIFRDFMRLYSIGGFEEVFFI